MITTLLLALVLQAPAAKVNDALSWDYLVTDRDAGPVTLFLVCLDGQATSACATVLESSGTAAVIAGTRTYQWKLPALVPGSHTVAVQACTVGAASCSAGATFTFVFQPVLANPSNLRLTKVGG
jgi:hypothetical protein